MVCPKVRWRLEILPALPTRVSYGDCLWKIDATSDAKYSSYLMGAFYIKLLLCVGMPAFLISRAIVAAYSSLHEQMQVAMAMQNKYERNEIHGWFFASEVSVH
jgi:hypothetical protein